MKRIMVLFLVCAMVAAIGLMVGCGGGDSESTEPAEVNNTGDMFDETAEDSTAPAEEGGEKVFTEEELGEYDGKDGRPAYVAVDGVVYDITGSSQWSDGEHSVCNLDAVAGTDQTEELEQSPPRMRDYVESKPVVGRMAE